jgi:lysophospholipase L1-like esterase
VWVGNVGKSGHLSDHHVLQVEKLLDQYPRIDLVVVLVGTNDMTKVGQNGRYVPLNEIERQLAFAVQPGVDVGDADLPFYKRTEIWRTLRKARDNLVASTEGKLVQDTLGSVYVTMRQNRRNAVRYLDDFPDLSEALSVYRANLNHIVDMAERHRTGVIFATQPSLWAESMTREAEDLLWMGRVGKYGEDVPADYYTPRAMAGAMNAYNAALLAVCRERSLDCLDLAAAVPKTPVAFYDDVHFTEAGAQIVADAMTRHVLGHTMISLPGEADPQPVRELR